MGGKGSKEDPKSPEGSNPFISNNRKCTDLLCLILFIVFWLGMLIIAGVGFSKGQPEKLVFGVDWRGRTCGASASANGNIPEYDFTDYKYLIYPRLTEDLFEMQAKGLSPTDPSNFKKLFGVCVKECPNPLNTAGDQLYVHAFYDYTENPAPVTTSGQGNSASENTNAGSPWLIPLNTTNVLYRCLDLQQFNSTAFVRCIDPCATNQTEHCGTDASNIFEHCGSIGCEKYIEDTFPKCKTVETKEEIVQKGMAKSSPIYDQLNSNWQLIARWIGDIEKAAVPILLSGGLFALILGFVWLVLLKHCAGFFVWLSIFLVIFMLLAGTLYLSYRGELIDADTVSSAFEEAGIDQAYAQDINTYIDEAGISSAQDQKHYWAIGAYIFMAIDVIIFLLLIFLCNRIKIAIGIIREASKSVQSMPFLILFPLIPTFLIICLVIYWVVTAAYVATSGEITLENIQDTYNGTASYDLAEYGDNNIMNYLLVYHLFGLLWTNQFLQALGYITIAGAVCEYYWTLDKTSISRTPIIRSFYRAIRYHLGTLAFGSLIIAIVQMIRLVLEYVDRKTKKAQEGNKVVKVALMCCKCFLWCFEQCLKFLNCNAYIIVAMKGSSFCTAMKDAFQLLLANAARVATVGIISTFLLLLGKLFIVAFASMCMFMFIYNPPSNMPSFFMGDLESVSSPIFPLCVTAVLAFAVASFFLGVYETAIDTILLCFCEDCKVNKATGTYYMSDELLSFVDGAAKKNAFRHFKDNGNSNVQESQV